MQKNKIKFTPPHVLSSLPRFSPILVGLSGGADSSALLHLLCEYGERTGCRIFAAHVNHGIRGEEYGFEADRDEKFCRETCRKLGVELFVRSIDIPALAKSSGRSLETEAREARYAFFAEIMRENNIRILATAHNLDDKLETQIFNLCRGCGIDGLIGIPATRELDGVEGGIVIRPLLDCEKSDILEYCKEQDIEYVTDSTNLEDDCTRNEIRHKIIPELSRLFPSLKKATARLSENAREDAELITNEAKRLLNESGGVIYTEKLLSSPPSVAKRVLMLAFRETSNASLEAVHLSDLLSLAENKKNGAVISLPGEFEAKIMDGVLFFQKKDEGKAQERVEYSKKLDMGLNAIENTPFAVYLGDSPIENSEIVSADGAKYELFASAVLNIENINSLFAKSRAPGAFIRDGGVNKKIKKLMCDKKIPLSLRDPLPVIYSGETVVYLPKCAVCDEAKPKKESKNIFVAILKEAAGLF